MIAEAYEPLRLRETSTFKDLLRRTVRPAVHLLRVPETARDIYWVGRLVQTADGHTWRVWAVTSDEDWFSDKITVHLNKPWLPNERSMRIAWLEDQLFPRLSP